MNNLGRDKKWRRYVVHCRKSEYDVYIGRNSGGAPRCDSYEWGNPFPMRSQSDDERQRVHSLYCDWILTQPLLMAKARSELKGKILSCWCQPKDCHGHVLAEIANSDNFSCFDTSEDAMPVTSISSSNLEREGVSSEGEETSDLNTLQLHLDRLSTDRTLTTQQRKNRRRNLSKKINRLKEEIGNLSQKEDHMAVPQTIIPAAEEFCHLVDIGINITNKQLTKKWQEVVVRAGAAGVTRILLTGTSLGCTEESIRRAEDWNQAPAPTGPAPSAPRPRLYCTAGIHPHEAKSFQPSRSPPALRLCLARPCVVAVGECGLDFHRNFSSPEEQVRCFEAQVQLAVELQKPLFVHEREAHTALLEVLDRFAGRLPPLVVHCFTGTAAEAAAYLQRGFYLGFTGTVCKRERGRHLRELLPSVPLHRIMLETDAPFMGFLKTRRESEPMDVVLVAEEVAKVLGVDVSVVRSTTTSTAINFFKL